MGLKKCATCEKDIAVTARTCPHCGAASAATLRMRSDVDTAIAWETVLYVMSAITMIVTLSFAVYGYTLLVGEDDEFKWLWVWVTVASCWFGTLNCVFLLTIARIARLTRMLLSTQGGAS